MTTNALLSNKPKTTRVTENGPKRKQATSRNLSDVASDISAFQEKFWETLSARARSGAVATPESVDISRMDPAKLENWGSSQGVEQLVDGTLEMAQVMLYSVLLPEEADWWQADHFQTVYSTIVNSVPRARRQQLLRSMLEGLEGAARTELQGAPAHASAQDENSPVSTAAFMAGLEDQEREQRVRDAFDGMLIPASQLALRLQMTPQGLHHALKAKRIFTLPGPSGELLYPAFFADPKQDRKILEKVSKALGDLPGAAKWDFFMSPRMSLGKRTPLEALAKGKVEAVMVAVQAFVEE